jgi:hypothetical protein
MSHDVCYVEGQRLLRACSNKVTDAPGTISGFGHRKSGILKRFQAGQFNDVVQIVTFRDGSYLKGFFSNEFCGFNKQGMTVKCVQKSTARVRITPSARCTLHTECNLLFHRKGRLRHIANYITS